MAGVNEPGAGEVNQDPHFDDLTCFDLKREEIP